MHITHNKLRVGVLMGGRSIEREVSFNSGRTICDHLDLARYQVVPLFQTDDGTLYILPAKFLHRGKIADFQHKLAASAQRVVWDQLPTLVDFVYLALHGRYGEDGSVQGMLEVLGLPYLGSKVIGSACGMDKARARMLLEMAGVSIPRGFVVRSTDQLTELELAELLNQHQICLPCIVKPTAEGSSLGVSIAHDLDQLLTAIKHAAHIDERCWQDVLIEEKVEGIEFVCALLQDRAQQTPLRQAPWIPLPLTQVCTEEGSPVYDYVQKYMPGRATKITPAPFSPAQQQQIEAVCTTVAQVLHFATIARIDGFYTADGRVVIIDPNSITGMAPATFLFHQAAHIGMSHTDLINYLIESECAAYGIQVTGEDMDDVHNNGGKKRMRVAVLFGGDSNEREVSLESGRNVCYKLSPHTYDVIPLFVSDKMELFKLSHELLIQNSTREIVKNCTSDIQVQWSALPDLCDFVFIGLHGGKGENGSVQGLLDMLDLPYNGSGVFTSALCMNKAMTNTFLATQGLDVPRGLLVAGEEWAYADAQKKIAYVQERIVTQIPFPLIVKPHDDGCSVMVHAINDLAACVVAIDQIFAAGKTHVLVEELIQGIELTCGVIGNETPRALPPSLAVVQGHVLSMEEKFLPGAGENQTPAPLPASSLELVQQTMERVYRAIGARGYVRIDCFWQSEKQSPTGSQRVVVLEVNTLPALTPATCLFHQAAEIGMRPMELVDHIVQLGIQAHQNRLGHQVLELGVTPCVDVMEAV